MQSFVAYEERSFAVGLRGPDTRKYPGGPSGVYLIVEYVVDETGVICCDENDCVEKEIADNVIVAEEPLQLLDGLAGIDAWLQQKNKWSISKL